MSERPRDQAARDRFSGEWSVNFAVIANAGSGKTTAISERLVAMACTPSGGELLKRTAVVTYTRKAATQIGQRARSMLLSRADDARGGALEPLARLEQVYFGTIHSFFLTLARRHGSTLGVHLNPTVIDDEDEGPWEAFIEQDPMTFDSLDGPQVSAFLRHLPLDTIFDLARNLDGPTAARLLNQRPSESPPQPSQDALDRILAARSARRTSADKLARNQEVVADWVRRFAEESESLPIPKPDGKAGDMDTLYHAFFAPLKTWLADVGGVLAAELSERYRLWRTDRGLQTYADQVETALALTNDPRMLETLRGEGWRIILDEAQDTDRRQFSVLVEMARPQGAAVGTWPEAGGPGPRPGHFCMVGDPQQGIYLSRADLREFMRFVDAFDSGGFGERLTFDVTFRTPHRVVRLLNETLAPAFGAERPFNIEASPGNPGLLRVRQVPYEPLAAGPGNAEGGAWRLTVEDDPGAKRARKAKDRRVASELRQVAAFLARGGPASVGAQNWGDLCILSPRVKWLRIVRDELEAAGVSTSLHMRQSRSGDHPVYAWLCGLLSVVCNHANAFEWTGVLRELFEVSDAMIAEALRLGCGFDEIEADRYPAPVRSAIETLYPFINRVDDEGDSLAAFASDLAAACGLASKARAIDPEGSYEDELERLLARAFELGESGAGPREWHADLLRFLDEPRATGRAEKGAVTLMSAHSAKGLEWPVVMPVAMFHEIRGWGEHAMRLYHGPRDELRVIIDSESLEKSTRDAIERERIRELVRLLYVTLTRARSALVIPWIEGRVPDRNSFARLWGAVPEALDVLGVTEAPAAPSIQSEVSAPEAAWSPGGPSLRKPPLPSRVRPHQLSNERDLARETLLDPDTLVQASSASSTDPIDYGIWWHETLEFLPWGGDEMAVQAHVDSALRAADIQGFGPRAREEWKQLKSSEVWRRLRDSRWVRQTEVGVFAPYVKGDWIDGVVDFVLHDPVLNELWIVDWKTNRRLAGEENEALLRRLSNTYEPQLRAYGICLSEFFDAAKIDLYIYSTVAGDWTHLRNSN